MKIKRVLKPGQPGTKKLLQRYGENLVCVRYRYNVENMRMIKTVELIVENIPWQQNTEKIPMNKLMSLRITANEVNLRKRVKTAGGKWNPKRQVWELPYKEVLELGLKKRIVDV